VGVYCKNICIRRKEAALLAAKGSSLPFCRLPAGVRKNLTQPSFHDSSFNFYCSNGTNSSRVQGDDLYCRRHRLQRQLKLAKRENSYGSGRTRIFPVRGPRARRAHENRSVVARRPAARTRDAAVGHTTAGNGSSRSNHSHNSTRLHWETSRSLQWWQWHL
jgi:hypothetical protein